LHESRQAVHFAKGRKTLLGLPRQVRIVVPPASTPMRQSSPDVALSADSGLFFQPVKFHFQLANLTEQQFRFTVSGDRLGPSFSLKQRFRLFLDRLLPLSTVTG
jgi:hypothetical protein